MKKIDHVGIAVKNLDEAINTYKKLGFTVSDIEEVPSQKVRVAFMKIGNSRIELLEPSRTDSPISKFLQKHGQGIHHLAIEVEDIEKKIESLESSRVNLIYKIPRQGAHGVKMTFVHPKSTNGVLLELCQYL
ncbi:MAG: methylmalonyl-CoA epimerase [Candidatus Cloacimonadota bacterium]|nr:methylmalonyl-CoA epimerase [Candidatus Cloacimonadota bacterium]